MVALRSTLEWTTPRPDSRTACDDDPDTFSLHRYEHYALVRKLYYARFSERVAAAGLDVEDGLQTVLEGVMRRSQSAGGSRWDPSRGSISTWLMVAISGLVINLVDQHRRAERRNGVLGGAADIASVADDSDGLMYAVRAQAPERRAPHHPRVIRRPRATCAASGVAAH